MLLWFTINQQQDNKQLCAYYVPKVNHREQAFSELEKSFVDTWKSVYDTEYENIPNYLSGNDFSGWNSSYTDKSIPINEMLEWRDSTVKKILSLNPSSVYEIGSGTGLIAYPLLKHVKKYAGIDFSEEVVRKFNSYLFQRGIDKAKAYTARADELDNPKFLKGSITVDTIIFNSVVQYFPDLQYLEDVLIKAVNTIDKGTVFIGDVRDYRLLKEFHLSVSAFKHLNDDNFSESNIADIIDANIRNESELLIAPEYFIAWSKKFSRINCVEILPKKGKFFNEMNRFRYDVIIYVNNNSSEEKKTELKWIEFDSHISLKKILKEGPKSLVLRNYPNVRVFSGV